MKSIYSIYESQVNENWKNTLKAGIYSIVMGCFALVNGYNATFQRDSEEKHPDIKQTIQTLYDSNYELTSILDYLSKLALYLQNDLGLYFVWDDLITQFKKDCLVKRTLKTDEFLALMTAIKINQRGKIDENIFDRFDIRDLKDYDDSNNDKIKNHLLIPIFDRICAKLKNIDSQKAKRCYIDIMEIRRKFKLLNK